MEEVAIVTHLKPQLRDAQPNNKSWTPRYALKRKLKNDIIKIIRQNLKLDNCRMNNIGIHKMKYFVGCLFNPFDALCTYMCLTSRF